MTHKTCSHKGEESYVDGNQTINIIKFFKDLFTDFYRNKNLTHFLNGLTNGFRINVIQLFFPIYTCQLRECK